MLGQQGKTPSKIQVVSQRHESLSHAGPEGVKEPGWGGVGGWQGETRLLSIL